jgi:TrpR family trp operon transcriptional repressor
MESNEWHALVERLSQAAHKGELNDLLQFLLTADEREALLVRAKIFDGLLHKSQSQRQLSQDIGVGIATITRGSKELQKHDQAELARLQQFLDGLFEQS